VKTDGQSPSDLLGDGSGNTDTSMFSHRHLRTVHKVFVGTLIDRHRMAEYRCATYVEVREGVRDVTERAVGLGRPAET